MSALMPSCVNCGGALDPLSLYQHVCQLGAQTQAARTPIGFTAAEYNEMQRLLSRIFDLEHGFDRVQRLNNENIGCIARQALTILDLNAELDFAAREVNRVTEELHRLKAKYEPDPPPAPNPWGLMFRGGVGAAIER